MIRPHPFGVIHREFGVIHREPDQAHTRARRPDQRVLSSGVSGAVCVAAVADGVGLDLVLGLITLPTIISSATADLPEHRTATGSAVVTMSGQIGSVVGVSLLVIFLTLPGHHADPHHNYAAAWLVAAALMVLSALAAAAIPRWHRG